MNEGTKARWSLTDARGPLAVFAVLASGLLFGAVACETLPPRLDCGALPDASACPTSRGGTCDDAACSALYRCTESGWAFVQRCEVGGFGGAGAGGAGGAAGAPLCEQVTRDAACPALQPPDCDEAAARACPTQACLGQCDVFLTCTSSGWSEEIAGYCDEGELILAVDRESGGNGGSGGSP